MSIYYSPKRKRNLYDPKDLQHYKLSRSMIELFLNCPRCFYLDRRLGIARPPGFPFTLNTAVDRLLKKEFDIHRAQKIIHPYMKAYKVRALPYQHEKLNEWRNNSKGVQFHHKTTNFLVMGAIDDLWVNAKGEVIVVDYKATSKDTEVTLEAEWQQSYKRQMEVYQWLLRRNGLKISDTGYFVYCNGRSDKEAFDGKLEFDVKIIAYLGNDDWVEPTLNQIYRFLEKDRVPKQNKDCDYCAYRKAVYLIESRSK